MDGPANQRMAKFGQWITHVIYMTCWVFMGHGIVLFILDVVKNPIGTITHSISSDQLQYDKLEVCTTGWNRKNGDPASFPLGHTGYTMPSYLPSRDHPDFDEMNWNWTKNSSSYEEWVENVQYLYDLRGANNTKKMTVEPRYLKGVYGCGKVSRYNHTIYQMVEDNTIQSEIFVYYFTVPIGRERTAMFTLLKPESTQPLGYEDFFIMKYGSSARRAYRSYTFIVASVSKRRFINSHRQPCKEPPEGTTNPVGYLQKKCNLYCSVKAHGHLQNCTPLLLLNQMEPNSSIPLCHQMNEDTKSQWASFAKMKNECTKREQCNKQRYCTEWNLDMVQTRPTGYNTNSPAFPGRTRHKVVFTLYPSMVFIEKYHIYTRESMMGNIGGLMGLWLGLSVYKIFECVLALSGFKCKAQQGEDEDKNQ